MSYLRRERRNYGKYELLSKRDSSNGHKRIQYNLNRKIKKKDKHKMHLRKAQGQCQFTPEDDERILRLVAEMGPKFVKIAPFFPNKSYSMVKNRYYKHLREKEIIQCKEEHESQTSNKKLEELSTLVQSINLSPEIMSLTQSFIRELKQCLT